MCLTEFLLSVTLRLPRVCRAFIGLLLLPITVTRDVLSFLARSGFFPFLCGMACTTALIALILPAPTVELPQYQQQTATYTWGYFISTRCVGVPAVEFSKAIVAWCGAICHLMARFLPFLGGICDTYAAWM